jgi:Fe-S cluster biogenesis protein NfuA
MHEADLALGLDVQRTLDRRIRPLLNVDAGDIEIVGVEDGHVRLELLGGCARCVLKLGCQVEMVLPVLRERFAERGARFSIRGVPEFLEEMGGTPRTSTGGRANGG